MFRLRYKLSFRNIAEMFLLRGFPFTHKTVRDWEERFALLMTEQLRRKRKGVGRNWFVDETYLKVKGKSVYLYRAIDKNGNLVDSLLSDKRDMNAARCFFLSAWSVAGRVPNKITTDGHPSYPRAIQDVFGKRVVHRNN